MQTMKTKFFFILTLLICQFTYAQNYSNEFLDGTLMFKLSNESTILNPNESNKTKDGIGLNVNLMDYPEIQAQLSDVSVIKFEKPSYFTGKRELMKIFRIVFQESEKIDEILNRLKSIEAIEFVEKETIYTFDFIPNDTYHSGNNKWYHNVVGSEAAWDITQGSSSIKVAIVDNAVFANHLDLTTFLQYDVADNDNDATPPLDANADFGWSHGTHCAGLATADINNNRGIASLGAAVELIGIKATPNSATSSGSIWYGYNGVQWACQNGANVVSMSYGSPTSQAAMQTLIDAYPNIVFLAAAGNDNSTTLQYPGAYNNVICVGSVNSNDARSSFSNYNGVTPYVDIASPGGYSFGGLYSTVYTAGGNSYAQMGGTSMATPFAAGLVGLMLSLNPTLSPSAIETCLTSTGQVINQNIGNRIDAAAALQCVQSTLTGAPIPYFTGTPLTIIEGDNVTFTDLSADGGNAITTWTWSFPGGTPSTFVGQNPPVIQYNTAGSYDVSLEVVNTQSTETYTQIGYVNVSVPPYGEWINQSSGFNTAARGINHISIVDPNIVWATAYDGSGTAANIQEFTKTTDGGLTWTPGTINVGNAGLGISMIHALDQTTAWLAAYPTAGGQTGGIWKTINGGTTWTRQNTATFNNAASFTNVVHFWDANEGFCQGDPINGDFELYRTTNGGTTWTLVPGASIPNPTNGNEFGYTRGIEVVGNSIWFSTSLGRLYHSTDRGVTWSVYATPVADFGGAITNGTTANFSFSSATDGVIINNSGAVYRTTNSGASWTLVPTTGSVFTGGLCAIEGTSTVFSTGSATGASGSSYSTDNGSTWNIIDTEQHLYVEFTNPSIGWSGWFNQDASTDGMWKWNDLSTSMVADFSASSLNTCTNSAVVYSDQTTGSTPVSWQWVFDGGSPATSTIANPSVTYASAGTYDVTLTVNDGTSQTSITQTAYVTVVAPAAVPSVVTGEAAICANATETYSVINNPNVVYNWTIPAGWSGTSATNSISVTADATSGTISVNAENVCGTSASSSLPITVNPGAPVAGFSSSNVANSYSFTSSSSDAATWSWDFGDGVGVSSLENPSYVYPTNGTFTVTLTVTNGCGTDVTTSSVTITGVGIDELLNDKMTFYPNPAVNTITVEVDQNLVEQSIELLDVTGKVIYSNKLEAVQSIIDVSKLASGIYYLQIKESNIKEKFVKK